MKGSDFDRERADMAAWMRKHTTVSEVDFSPRLKRYAEAAYKMGHAAGHAEALDTTEVKIRLATAATRLAVTAILGSVGMTVLVSIAVWWYLH